MADDKHICEHCGTENRVGALICVGCHRLLTENGKIGGTDRLKQKPYQTSRLDEKTITSRPFPGERQRSQGTATLTGQTIRIRVHGFENGEIVRAFHSGTIMFGRLDTERNIRPEVDLTPYRAYEHGVSRCHALLRREGTRMLIQDLGSSNGTFLNGNKLPTQTPKLVHDGDTIRLGRLVLQVFFASTR